MTQDSTLTMPDSISVRDYLTNSLRLDLIGPRPQDAELQNERLRQAPSRWYLTGFLVPTNAPDEQRAQDNEEEFDELVEPSHGSDDSSTPDRGSGKQNFLPSSMGLSIIVDDDTTYLDVEVSWGDYAPESNEKEKTAANGGTEPAMTMTMGKTNRLSDASRPGFAIHARGRCPSISPILRLIDQLNLKSRIAMAWRLSASSDRPGSRGSILF